MKNLRQLAEVATQLGAARCAEPMHQTFFLGLLAGGYVAMAGLAMLTLTARLGETPAGLTGLLSGLVFTAGLVMVVTAGGELFTGNCLMPMNILNGNGDWIATLHNWIVVYLGNLAGSLIVVVLFWASNLWTGDGALAARAIHIAHDKVALPFIAAFARGVLCNWLVTLSIWVSLAADSLCDKVIGVLFPITIFILSGYEHCVANMFFLPAGWLMAQLIPGAEVLTLTDLLHNLIPVTLGNAIGGVVFVPLAYTLALKTER